ncbi:MAG TPA: CRISPR-associated protein Csx15 [Anaerolineae bacterium]|nr:CRISPR-associated protein Csx15 [Anaerolineae bacterium]
MERVVERMTQFEHARPFAEQVQTLVDKLGLSPSEWRMMPILLNPPGYVPATATLLAELHGRPSFKSPET